MGWVVDSSGGRNSELVSKGFHSFLLGDCCKSTDSWREWAGGMTNRASSRSGLLVLMSGANVVG